MSQHTAPFTLPTQSKMMDARSLITRDISQERGTRAHQDVLLSLLRDVEWWTTKEDWIVKSVQLIQERLYGSMVTPVPDDNAPDGVLIPSRDFRRIEAKFRVRYGITDLERAAMYTVRLYDDVMYALGLPVR